MAYFLSRIWNLTVVRWVGHAQMSYKLATIYLMYVVLLQTMYAGHEVCAVWVTQTMRLIYSIVFTVDWFKSFVFGTNVTERNAERDSENQKCYSRTHALFGSCRNATLPSSTYSHSLSLSVCVCASNTCLCVRMPINSNWTSFQNRKFNED